MIAPLIADELRAIEQRADAAPPGPWSWSLDLRDVVDDEVIYQRVLETYRSADYPGRAIVYHDAQWAIPDEVVEFIAHAREDVPRLIATVKALRTVLYGVGWNDMGIDIALEALGPEVKR